MKYINTVVSVESQVNDVHPLPASVFPENICTSIEIKFLIFAPIQPRMDKEIKLKMYS